MAAEKDDGTGGKLRSLIYSSGDDDDDDAGSHRGGRPTLKVLDQLLLPAEKKYIDVVNVKTTWSVIRDMNVRGAPLIAIVACLGLAVDLCGDAAAGEMSAAGDDAARLRRYVQEKLDYLATSRPTAVNLFHALEEIRSAVEDAAVAKEDGTAKMPLHCRIAAAVKNHAEFMLNRDVADNRNIGKHGADAILAQDNVESAEEQVTIMTICNTGSLATSEYGTALGVVRAVHERNRLKSVVALETRPYNQGSRLTAYEIVHDELPGGTLICDSMAAAYMKRRGTVHAVVTGADRVAANGDTANKIGTYGLAVAAAAHGVPFYVAAPFTTLDTELASGADTVIEERPAAELLETSRAPENIDVWNPAFDVTPAEYITGIVTERGVLRRDDVTGRMDVAAFVKQHT